MSIFQRIIRLIFPSSVGMMLLLLFVQPLLLLSTTISGPDRVAEGRLLIAAFENLSERTMLVVHDLREVIAKANRDGDADVPLTETSIPELVWRFMEAKMKGEEVCDEANVLADTDPQRFVGTEIWELAKLGDTWTELVIYVMTSLPTDSIALRGLEKVFRVLHGDWFDFRFALSVFVAETDFIKLKLRYGVSAYSHAGVNFFNTVLAQYMFNRLPDTTSLLARLAPDTFEGTVAENAILSANEQVIISAVENLTATTPYLSTTGSGAASRDSRTGFDRGLPKLAKLLAAAKQDIDTLVDALPSTRGDPLTHRLYEFRKWLSVRVNELGSLLKHTHIQLSRS